MYKSEKQKASEGIVLQRLLIILAVIVSVIFTILFFQDLKSVNKKYLVADAQITNIEGPKINITGSRVAKTYRYIYSFTCRFIDDNGVEQHGILKRSFKEEQRELNIEPITIYYAVDFESGDEVYEKRPDISDSAAGRLCPVYWTITLILVVWNFFKSLSYKSKYGESIPLIVRNKKRKF